MFPNLEAEQARKSQTNEDVAQRLGITRQAYEHKKKNGTFKLREIRMLLTLYQADFSYLFSTEAMAS